MNAVVRLSDCRMAAYSALRLLPEFASEASPLNCEANAPRAPRLEEPVSSETTETTTDASYCFWMKRVTKVAPAPNNSVAERISHFPDHSTAKMSTSEMN